MDSKILLSSSLLIVTSLVTAIAQAAETPLVLPKNINRFRIVGIYTDDIVDKYNADGKLEGMTSSLNRSLTISDFARKEPKLLQLQSALNGLQAGLGDQVMGANLYSDFRTQQQQYLLAYERGLTNQISLGIRVPIVHTTVNARFSAVGINNSSLVAAQIGSLSPALTAGLFDANTKTFNTAFFEQSLFAGKGYEIPHDFDKTEVGDTEFGAKYAFLQGEQVFISGLLGTRVPTGSSPSLSNIFDKGTGAGSWGAAAQLLGEVRPTPWLAFGVAQKATYSFSDTRTRAVPRDDEDSLPSLKPEDGQVQNVTRTQPMLFESEVNAQVKLFDQMISTWTAYQFAAQGETSYSGPGNLDYAVMSKDSSLRATRLEFGLGFSSINLFRKKRVPIPMEVEGLYNTGLSGQNVPLASYSRVDLKMYF